MMKPGSDADGPDPGFLRGGEDGAPECDSSHFIDPKKGADLMTRIGLKGVLKPFGSYTSGLITKNSDLDVMYERHAEEKDITPAAILQRFRDKLPELGFCNFVTVYQASKPLLKLMDRHGVDIDICVDNHLGYWNSLLMGSYARVDRRVPDFIRRIKCFAKRYEIVGSTDGHLNSYAWTLMAVYFLMHATPCPVVPNLQALASEDGKGIAKKVITDSRWGEAHQWDVSFFIDIGKIPPGANDKGLDALCAEFFQFYAEQFDWNNKAVSIRHGLTEHDSPTGVDKSKLSDFILGQKEQSGWFVEDPFDLCHNLAGNCTPKGKDRILQALKQVRQATQVATDPELAEIFAKVCPMSWRAPWLFLKCRVSLDKISEEEFVSAFREIEYEDDVFVWFPKLRSRGAQGVIFDAFLQFKSDKDRKKAHTKSESYVGSWQIRLLYCCRGILSDYNAEAVKYCRVPLTPAAAERPVVQPGAQVSEEVLKSMHHIETSNPRIKNFAALNHLYRISQNQIEQIRKSAEKTTQIALHRNPGLMHRLGITMSTVSYLLGIMDSEFLEHFLQDHRNEPLIRQLKGLHQQYATRLSELGQSSPSLFPSPSPSGGEGFGSRFPSKAGGVKGGKHFGESGFPHHVSSSSSELGGFQSGPTNGGKGASSIPGSMGSGMTTNMVGSSNFGTGEENKTSFGPTTFREGDDEKGVGNGTLSRGGSLEPEYRRGSYGGGTSPAGSASGNVATTVKTVVPQAPPDGEGYGGNSNYAHAHDALSPREIVEQRRGIEERLDAAIKAKEPLSVREQAAIRRFIDSHARDDTRSSLSVKLTHVCGYSRNGIEKSSTEKEHSATTGPGGTVGTGGGLGSASSLRGAEVSSSASSAVVRGAQLAPNQIGNTINVPPPPGIIETVSENPQNNPAGSSGERSLGGGKIPARKGGTTDASLSPRGENTNIAQQQNGGKDGGKDVGKYLTPHQMETFLRENPLLVQAALANPELLASFMDPQNGSNMGGGGGKSSSGAESVGGSAIRAGSASKRSHGPTGSSKTGSSKEFAELQSSAPLPPSMIGGQIEIPQITSHRDVPSSTSSEQARLQFQ